MMRLKKGRKEFLRFFLGVASDKDKEVVYHSKESDTMLVETWENLNDLKDKGVSFDKNGVFQKIQDTISISNNQVTKLNVYSFVRKYAAVLIIGVVIGGSALYLGIIRPALENSIAIIELTNLQREQIELLLPDGSKVALNTKSTIKYPKKFTERNRSVELNGEAFFEVERDTAKPFIVKTADLAIEVLGTSFNVMSYSDDTTIETTLITGKVKITRLNPITNKIQSVILTPNHKARFLKNEERFIMDQVNVNTAISWKKGLLIFDNEPFESIVSKLERWYDVKIVLSDDLKNKYRYTFCIDHETIEEVLEMIKKTSPVNYTKANGEIVFYSSK